MEVDSFYVPHQRPYMWNYFLESFKLQDSYSSDLKGLFESSTNISNAPNKIRLLKRDFFEKKILTSDKEKKLVKINFSIGTNPPLSEITSFCMIKATP